jgi:hypothetical protein
MALQSLSGGFMPLGPRILSLPASGVSAIGPNAANIAAIFIGRIVTSDGGSHTLDTTGSSSLGWRADSVTFANAGTTCAVGLAPVDTGNGPPARPSNTTNVINFDVKATFTGGGGGIATGWQSSVPTTGTKTIANGDLVAFAVQMTARGGADVVLVSYLTTSITVSRPTVTGFNGSSYSNRDASPNCFITFSDGAFGWFEGSDVVSTTTTRTWNSGSATKEYGQLYQMPFPMKVRGIYGTAVILNDTDVVLYSDPLGTPVAQKTVSIDANAVASTSSNFFYELFASPYTAAANQPLGAILKPGASNISTFFKTQNNAAHRITDPWGTSGYGISRASGAFANANSSLDHYYIGLIVSAFDDGAGGGGGCVIGC